MDLKPGALNYSSGGGDMSQMQAEIQAMQERGEALVIDLVPTEGQAIVAPAHNHSLLVLNLRPAGALNELSVQIAGAGQGNDGDRVFIHCTQQVGTIEVTAPGCTVFNPWISPNPGDSFAFLQNDSNTWSRITS